MSENIKSDDPLGVAVKPVKQGLLSLFFTQCAKFAFYFVI
jgi:hypothetical protein